ncbi:MAG: M48 family metallopeptidase [Firmicutes bacterium]|nr:M48 family metallopeptidase [Bacillota bacterium]
MLHPKNIIRSNRKVLSLYINPHGELIVKAPLKLPEHKIFEFVKDKETWIRTQQKRIQQNQFINPNIITYNTFLFLGREVSPIISTKAKKITVQDSALLIPEKIAEQGHAHSLKKIEKFLRDNAKQIVQDRTHYFSQKLNLQYNSIKTMNNKSRWGVCSKNREIALNWRTVMLPPELLDYIIVHEFCHILEFNHSKQFWSLVESILPNWKVLRKNLKNLNYLISLFRPE